MPELAEVEFYRKQWDPGLRRAILRVHLHGEKRLFRGTDVARLAKLLPGSRLLRSEARAKQMLFQFSHGLWLGIHLGMTGRLRCEPAGYQPGRHDHLVLFQKTRALVFTDPRIFGRVRFSEGRAAPAWWSELPAAVTSPEWTADRLKAFCRRRARLAVKAALIVQSHFPGVGNWMADEILWRARIHPARLCGELRPAPLRALWQETREVCRLSLETVGVDFADPPAGWLFHVRWSAKGRCPRDHAPLQTARIGGRTTRWCAKCQRAPRAHPTAPSA